MWVVGLHEGKYLLHLRSVICFAILPILGVIRCHLPLLGMGMEHQRTNNLPLAHKVGMVLLIG